MSTVTIALAAHPLGSDRYLVAAWLSARNGQGGEHTRGLAEVWVGPVREGVARIAIQALDELSRPSDVEIVLRRHDPAAPPPEPATAAALARAWERHTVTFTPLGDAARHPEIEEAERFAAARAAGVRTAPGEVVRPAPPPKPPEPGRLF